MQPKKKKEKRKKMQQQKEKKNLFTKLANIYIYIYIN